MTDENLPATTTQTAVAETGQPMSPVLHRLHD